MRVRTTVAGLLVGAAVAAAGVVVAPTASAATTCQGSSAWGYGSGGFYSKPTTTANSYDTNCILGYGASTPAVGVLQDAANKCYNQGLVYDGVYGPATQQAVRNIQNFHGIPADGTFGPQTSNAMVWPKYNSSFAFIGCWI